jgi:hypothetical protein
MRALASNLEASRTFEAPFPLKIIRTKRRPWPESPSVAPHHRHPPAQPAECAQDTATSTKNRPGPSAVTRAADAESVQRTDRHWLEAAKN